MTDDHKISDVSGEYRVGDAAARLATQPEQVLEDDLVAQLVGLGFERATVSNEDELLANLKARLEAFNNINLSEAEFRKVVNHLTRSPTVFARARTLRDRCNLQRDDGSRIWLRFFDGDTPLNNHWQVTQQVKIDGRYANRYDVTLLVNGLPLVQIELKRRGLEMKEAFNQIQRYQKHSFWAGQGFFNFVQLFVISNGVNTKYYANARRQSFKQTFYWAREDNNTIRELSAFARAFLNPERLGRFLARYIVLHESDKILMALRPYQVYAVEKIVERVMNPPDTKSG